MKKLLLAGIVALSITTTNAQTPFTTTVDKNNVTILNGIVAKKDIATNAAFANWYSGNKNSYRPDTSVTNAMTNTKDKVQYVVFGGTWCEDTQFILPKFFKLQEQSGLSERSEERRVGKECW